MSIVRPFLKWAGNKYRQVERIQALLPEAKRLVEPFSGSCALFLNSQYKTNLLAEKNTDLVNLYQHIQKEGQTFIDYVRCFFTEEANSPDAYYAQREIFNSTDDVRLKSALFIYLNKHCFNGLCRYNQSGKFNVPFGKYKKVALPEASLLHFYERSQKATFVCQDFEKTFSQLKKGDVVYCDPPYVPLSDTAYFDSYHTGGFTTQQQVKLAQLAESAAARGITVIISNHDTKTTRELYTAAKLYSFSVLRSISARAKTRISVREILAVFN